MGQLNEALEVYMKPWYNIPWDNSFPLIGKGSSTDAYDMGDKVFMQSSEDKREFLRYLYGDEMSSTKGYGDEYLYVLPKLETIKKKEKGGDLDDLLSYVSGCDITTFENKLGKVRDRYLEKVRNKDNTGLPAFEEFFKYLIAVKKSLYYYKENDLLDCHSYIDLHIGQFGRTKDGEIVCFDILG